MENYFVAKSYQNLEKIEEPFILNGKMYINVKLKTGNIKNVRVYTEKEYYKLYPEEKTKTAAPTYTVTKTEKPKPQKNILGFEKGYITIFKGDTEQHQEWFNMSIARYAKWWGWYIVSTDTLPDLPIGLEPARLYWESVGGEDGRLYSDEKVRQAVDAVRYDAGVSEFVGVIGDRVEMKVVVDKAIELESDYGHQTMHIMTGTDNNEYVWVTASKSWAPGAVKTIRGTIKNHRVYKGVKQNILTRCLEVK